MATTQPIRNTSDLNALKHYFLYEKPNPRNYALIITGINTALRIGDILSLRWNDVYDFSKKCFRMHLEIHEHKTGKENMIALNENVTESLDVYRKSQKSVLPEHFIFCGNNPEKAISRTQAFRIIKNACQDLNLPDNISCHSLRKTFGYHAWASGVSPAILMIIYNHSSFQITKRYLGIEQDDKDKIFLDMKL